MTDDDGYMEKRHWERTGTFLLQWRFLSGTTDADK